MVAYAHRTAHTPGHDRASINSSGREPFTGGAGLRRITNTHLIDPADTATLTFRTRILITTRRHPASETALHRASCLYGACSLY